MTRPVLEISELAVRFATAAGPVQAIRSASLTVGAGETVAVVGESGSGKSQLALAILGLTPQNGTVSGAITFQDQSLIGIAEADLNRIRGNRIGMIFQEPMTSLDPLHAVGSQIIEPIRRHQRLGHTEARAAALKLMSLVRIPEPASRFDAYPHQLSGGQRQRVMIAMAIANKPSLLIADEPTTALDVTIQAEILKLLADLRHEIGMSLLFITHDLGIVRRIADRVVVLRQGEVVETGTVADIFRTPKADYTRALLAAEPTGRKQPVAATAPVALAGREVSVSYRLGGDWFGGGRRSIKAVDHVSLTVRRGETVGVVGESGSGKSTLARALLRLVPAQGAIILGSDDISLKDRAAMRPLRRHMQVVLQDPFGSLSPRLTAGEIVTEGLKVHEPRLSQADRDDRAIAAFSEVGLDPATRSRFPHAFSGGQRQRLAIARAMILRPKVVILDEPTSALDRQVQRQIVDLLRDLQRVHDLAYVFISHDLAVVRAMADRILVMRDGRLVEEGSADDILLRPREAYTRTLIAAAHLQESAGS